jgi:hypothetical protein
MRKIPFLVTAIALASGAVQALPVLQLDIAGGTYDNATQTTVTGASQFDLSALLNSQSAAGTYYISMALTPQTSVGGNYGSFTVNGHTVNATANMVYGTPPLEADQAFDPGDLSAHSIYPTYFYEYAFSFDPTKTVGAYNVADNTTAPGSLFSQTFHLDVSGMTGGAGLHFDLYDEVARGGDLDVGRFAPYSHDAEYAPPSVPEPGTLGLMGLGLCAIPFIARRRKA